MAIALMSGADSALLYDILKQEGREDDSKKIFGRARSFTLLGIFISAPLGGFIASKLGLNSPMLFSAFPFLLAAIVAWTIKEPENKNKTSESKRYLIIAKKGLSYFQHHPTLRLLALDAIVVASAAYFVIWLYQPLLTNLNVPIYYFGWFHAFLVGIEILISSNFVRLEKLFGSGKKYFRFTAMVTALSFFLAALHPNLFTITLLIIFAGGFGLTRLDLMNAYMNKHIPSEQRATILSSISMFRRLALVFLNPIIGFTADHSLRLALLIVGLLPLTIFIFSPLRNQENI
jgi:MFS family permease